LATRPQEPGDAQAAGVAAPARDTLADRLGAADGGVPAPTALGLMIGLGALAVLAAAMPILMVVFGLPESLISALIVGFALHQAWRMNGRAKITFTGPFRVGAAPSVGGAAGA
jgi:hypothetical protein